jgi:hypothetical protein
MGEECTITLGERRYAVERGFGALPKSMSLGLPSQVAVDSQSRVHLYQRNGPPVLMFDADGRLATASSIRMASIGARTIGCSWSIAMPIR